MTNLANLGIDGLTELEGIELGSLGTEPLFDGLREIGDVQDSLIRGLRDIVHLDDFRAAALLVQELDGGQEEVVEQSPLAGVELIEQVHEPWIIEVR